MSKILTLCLLKKGDSLLLGKKKRGFGLGKWNGFGGKLEPGESLETAARREMMEECGITILDLEERGVLLFTFEDGTPDLEVHVFAVAAFSGEPQESEEMEPAWFPVDALPFAEMWADDKYWMPLFLAGKKFHGTFHFTDTETLLSHAVGEVYTDHLTLKSSV